MHKPLSGTVAFSRGFIRDMPVRVKQYVGTKWETDYPFRACVVDLHGYVVCVSMDAFKYPGDAEEYADLLWHLMRPSHR